MSKKRYRNKPESQYEWVGSKVAAKHFGYSDRKTFLELRTDGAPHGMPRRIVANNIIHKLWRNTAAKDKRPNLSWNIEAIAMWMDNEYDEALFDEKFRSAA